MTTRSKAERCVKTWIIKEISDEGLEALIRLVMRIGTGPFIKSNTLRQFNRKEFDEGSDEFKKWVEGKLVRAV